MPVGGWLSQGDGLLKITEEGLQVHSPGIRTRGLPRETGRLKLAWRMRTSRAAGGRVFWSGFTSRPYDAERSAEVSFRNDGEWHEYAVEFETGDELYGLRMDFGTGSPPVEIGSIQLSRQGGALLAHWDF